MLKPMPNLRLILLVALVLTVPKIVHSGELRVTPIKLTFDQKFKNGLINVINEGDDSIQVEIKATEWVQDSEGKDKYNPTSDIIFFPKILKIKKGEKRSIRAGIKSPAISTEKTYRIFIKELPQATERTPGAHVRFAVQFGVPVFSMPVKEEYEGEITDLSLGNGQLAFKVHNSGNAHFRINSIKIRGLDANGADAFASSIDGWYVLAGATLPYSTPISRENCEDVSKLSVEVISDKLTLRDDLDVVKTLCLP